ncbi:MAG: dihydrodipicolinate synthase family protein [Oscillospiraceae bacterium]|nr:dihydrodipicolinate synthase family protein [Oscillospiraceae bacterium]
MKLPFEFRGQMPILPTTIRPDGELDLESLRNVVDYCLANKAAAIGHLGGASEYYKVGVKQREQIIATVVERVNGKVPVFIGTTDLSFVDSMENARIAQKLGADMLMVCSPIFGAMPKDRLFDYYQAVADASDLPIIVQDTGASGACYDVDFMVKLGENIPTCLYAKPEGAGFLEKTQDLIARTGDRMQIIGGAAGFHMIQLLRLGVSAFMTGTEAAEIHNEVIFRYLNGDTDGAIDVFYTQLLPYLELFNLSGRYFLKHMLCKRGLIAGTTLPFPQDNPVPSPLLIAEFDYIWERIQQNKIKETLI